MAGAAGSAVERYVAPARLRAEATVAEASNEPRSAHVTLLGRRRRPVDAGFEQVRHRFGTLGVAGFGAR